MENLKLTKQKLLAIEKIRKQQSQKKLPRAKKSPKAKKSTKQPKKAEILYFPPVPVHFYGSSKPAEALPRSSKVENIIQSRNSTKEEYITITFDDFLRANNRI